MLQWWQVESNKVRNQHHRRQGAMGKCSKIPTTAHDRRIPQENGPDSDEEELTLLAIKVERIIRRGPLNKEKNPTYKAKIEGTQNTCHKSESHDHSTRDSPNKETQLRRSLVKKESGEQVPKSRIFARC